MHFRECVSNFLLVSYLCWQCHSINKGLLRLSPKTKISLITYEGCNTKGKALCHNSQRIPSVNCCYKELILDSAMILFLVADVPKFPHSLLHQDNEACKHALYCLLKLQDV